MPRAVAIQGGVVRTQAAACRLLVTLLYCDEGWLRRHHTEDGWVVRFRARDAADRHAVTVKSVKKSMAALQRHGRLVLVRQEGAVYEWRIQVPTASVDYPGKPWMWGGSAEKPYKMTAAWKARCNVVGTPQSPAPVDAAELPPGRGATGDNTMQSGEST